MAVMNDAIGENDLDTLWDPENPHVRGLISERSYPWAAVEPGVATARSGIGLMFYGTVTVVALKGVGDVVAMIGKMMEGRHLST